MDEFVYKGSNTKEISFPIGGIGTGCIGIGGNGRFKDIEIMNRPNKKSHSGFTHFAIKAEDSKKVIDARILNSDLIDGYLGEGKRTGFKGYGFGPDRQDLTGLPHFDSSEFMGKFPTAEIEFGDKRFPGRVCLTAFNPFIPSSDFDSSLPAAFFDISIKNDSDKSLKYTVAFNCNNYYSNISAQKPIHESFETKSSKGIFLTSTEKMDSLKYGDLTILSDNHDVNLQQYWYRGLWYDGLTTYWNDFTRFGSIQNREYNLDDNLMFPESCDNIAVITASVKLNPDEDKNIRFVLTWNMPYMNNYWQLTAPNLSETEIEKIRSVKWKNYYATRFESSKESALYCIDNFSKLYKDTKLFQDALYSSTMPKDCIDAVASNLSVLKSPTCLRLEDGSFYGFEGCHADAGCCEGTCTHVWSYAQAAAFLFPNLERSARTLEYTHSVSDIGGMSFRLQLPLGSGISSFRPCVDGQFGTAIRVYREFLLSGDIRWLKSIWSELKKTIEFAWHEDNPDRWDLKKDGIVTGRQHHTLDMELFGANSWLTGMYLAGLKAAAEMAKILGDIDAYSEYIDTFKKGKEKLNTMLYNGEYFIHKIDISDERMLKKFSEGATMHGQSAHEAYWNDESRQVKYQIGKGCSIDQVLGQWHADILGLGNIFDTDKTKSALKSIYKYNYVSLRDHFNPCRIYSLNDEKGLTICSYPNGREKNVISMPYAEETMTGFEYQAASHMIMNGMAEEGAECIKSIRERFDGEKRNPWNEFECGSNYARSMASYAILLAYSGFKFDMNKKIIGFAPAVEGDCSFFWSVDGAWGTVEFIETTVKLNVLFGTLVLSGSYLKNMDILSIVLNNREIAFAQRKYDICFDKNILIHKGETMSFYTVINRKD